MQRHDFVRSDDGSGLRTLEEPPPPFESHIRAIIQAVIAVAVVLLALWVARDFLVALIWAGVIAITTWPIYVRFAQLISGRPSSLLASLLFTSIIGLVLLAPIVLTVRQVAQGSDAFVHVLNRLRESGVVVPIGSRSCRSPANISISGGVPTSAILRLSRNGFAA